jgi:hypothetical protein
MTRVASKSETPKTVFELCTHVRDRDWFSFKEVAERTARAVLLNYFLMVWYPISFFIFTLNYNRLWYGTPIGLLITAFYPVTPFAIFILLFNKKMLKKICTLLPGPVRKFVPKALTESFDDGNVFFVAPPSIAAAVLWDFLKDYGMYVACFLQVQMRPGL